MSSIVRAPAPAPASRLAGVVSSPVREILALTAREEVISFAGGLPAPELFDVAALREAFATALDDRHAGRALQYSTTEGHAPLRQALAARMVARGLATDPDDVLITTGSQQALGLAASALLDPGDVVLVEDPSYLAALQSFALAGARLVPVPSGPDGPDLEIVRALVLEHRPKLLYVVPTFQNPTGRTISSGGRAALAALAGELGLWLLEDDPYGELRYDGQALPSLGSFPGAEDRTIAVSSLSKVLAPGLRIGWLRAPEALKRALTIAKQAGDLHTSTVDQMAAATVLTAGGMDAHLARLRTTYRARRDALLDGLPAALPTGSSWNEPDGGMFVWARLPEGADATALLVAALRHDVAFVPGAPFYAGAPDPRTLRLSFTTHGQEEIAEGLRRLAAAVTDG
ncbi:MAG: PLP-dependent aminotransferase family protein [Solirubrobacterales bacterium]|nr:PLP-dependent aminotransferase family protein [Solirubrobacterales bacterium]